MIKGVNKQVLEIFETENGYFEKALFFVKPEYSGYSENKLREIAQNELRSGLSIPQQKTITKRKKLSFFLILSMAFALGAALGYSITFLI